jgi:GNAT superfamily N-acetyltransferase
MPDVIYRQPRLPPGWTPRHYRDQDLDGVLELLLTTFSRWPAAAIQVPAIDHLRWKMASHPGALQLNVVGEVEGKIIAWQCYWLQRVKVQERELLAKQGVDFCVHPDYQRLGIRRQLWQFAADTPRRNFQVLFGPASTHPAMRRVEAELSPAPTSTVANVVQALVLEGSSPSGRLAAATQSAAIHEAERFDDRFDAFWEASSAPFDFACVRDSTALNWRYADERAGRFTILVAEDAGRIAGFAACKEPEAGRASIGDLLALPGREDIALGLLERATSRLFETGASKVEAWLPACHPYQDIFAASGFRPRSRPVTFGLRPALEYLSTLDMSFRQDPAAAIHISLGDSDLV